jgi:hypothetical protein
LGVSSVNGDSSCIVGFFAVGYVERQSKCVFGARRDV